MTERDFGPAVDKQIIEGFLADEEATLQLLEQAGFERAAILKRAKALFRHRTRDSYKVNPSQLAVRDCLGCTNEFLSSGPQHRFCADCRQGIERKEAR
jgi:hypothetical protein